MTEFEKFLIKEEDNMNISPVLADIRKYSVGVLLKFTKSDFIELRKKGFELKDFKLSSCRQSLREFLELHPCCMSCEKEKIMEKVLEFLHEHFGDIEVEFEEETKPKRKTTPKGGDKKKKGGDKKKGRNEEKLREDCGDEDDKPSEKKEEEHIEEEKKEEDLFGDEDDEKPTEKPKEKPHTEEKKKSQRGKPKRKEPSDEEQELDIDVDVI